MTTTSSNKTPMPRSILIDARPRRPASVRFTLSLCALAALALAAVACEPGESLSIVNTTNETVVLELQSGRQFEIEPGDDVRLTKFVGNSTAFRVLNPGRDRPLA